MDHDNSVPGAGAPGADRARSSDTGDARRDLPGIDPRLVADLGLETADRGRAPDRDDDRARKPRKRGFWRGVGYLLGGPISAVGMDNITESASVIRGLAQRIRTGQSREALVRVFDDRTLDLEATACDAGISVADVRALLANRRRQTRRAVLCYLGGAIGFFCLWVWLASATAAYARPFYVVLLLVICGLFCLSAFYNALLNWQCRTERLGTWREFLGTEESWWPT
jgi:hypothetical protein